MLKTQINHFYRHCLPPHIRKRLARSLADRRIKISLIAIPLLLLLLLLLLLVRPPKSNKPRFNRNLFTNSYSAALSSVGMSANLGISSEGAKIEVSRANSTLSMTIPLNKAKISEKDNQVVYTVPEKVVETRYKPLENGLKEEIILNQKPGNSDFSTEINVKNLSVKITSEGIPVFYDSKTGEYQFHFDRPFAKDAKGNVTYGVSYKLIKKEIPEKLLSPLSEAIPKAAKNSSQNAQKKILLGNPLPVPLEQNSIYVLITTVDSDWLNDPQRAYPVVIDPSITHNSTEAFNNGSKNRIKDTGSPNLETYYQELPADIHTVALWHMNEGSGTTASDSSGNGNVGTLSGSTPPSWNSSANSKLGNSSLSFNGTTAYVSVANESNFDFERTQPFSIEAWVKYPTAGSNQDIFSKMANTSPYTGYEFWIDTSNRLNFYLINSWTNNALYVNGQTTINDTNWHHIAVTYDGSSKASGVNIYIDGKKEILTVTYDTLSATILNNISPMIGTRNNSTLFFSGSIDEVRISNIARTPEEIKTDAQRRPYGVYTSDVIDLSNNVTAWNSLSWTEVGVGTGDGETLANSTGLIAQWNFNETSGTTATNNAGSCGSSCNGTLTNFANTSGQDVAAGSGWTSANRRWGAGALMFDGTDDYVNLSSTTNLALTTYTISGWFKTSDMSDYKTITSRNTSSTARNWWIAIWKQGDTAHPEGSLVFRTSSGGAAGIDLCSNTKVADGQWHHFAAIVNGTTSAQLYVDGILRASTSSIGLVDTPSTNAIVGNDPSVSGRYFKGVIDSLSIYSRALSASEILSNYNAGNIELQTRVGADASPDDGSWEEWRPITAETLLNGLNSDQANWSWDNTATYMPKNKTDESVVKVEGTGSMKLGIGAPQPDANTVGLWHMEETSGTGAYIKDAKPITTPVIDSGDGTDGAITISSSVNCTTTDISTADGDTTADCAASSISSLASAGQTNVLVNSTSGFYVGDEVLIIQITGTGIGNYEFKRIQNIISNILIMTTNLSYTYQSTGAQVVRIPQYTNVTINNGGILTASAWNGTIGGIIAFRASGSVTVNDGGAISATSLGFAGGATTAGGSGGAGGCSNWCNGGTGGASVAGNAGSGPGGGGGGGAGGGGGVGGNHGSFGSGQWQWCGTTGAGGGGGGTPGGGAGGSWGTMGSNGTAGQSGNGGTGQSAESAGGAGGSGGSGAGGTANFSSSAKTNLVLGSGGGSGGSGAGGGGGGGVNGDCGSADGGAGGNGGNGGAGGKGGGIIFISANSISISSLGSITANGSNGSPGTNGGNGSNGADAPYGNHTGSGGGGSPGANGGGGSGGTIHIKGATISLNSSRVTANGGSGSTGAHGGGNGATYNTDGGGGAGNPAGSGYISGATVNNGNGGNGGDGVIRIEYSTSLSGSTTPYAYIDTLLPNDGTPIGTTVADGFAGKARSFATNDYITHPVNNFQPAAKTIEMWVKPNWSGNDGVAHGLWQNNNNTNVNQANWVSLFKWSGNQLYFRVVNPSGGLQDCAPDATNYFSPGKWTYIAAAYDSSGLALYVDGTLVCSTGAITVPNANLDSTARIGFGHQASFGSGIIDEVRISNIKRSAEEIAEAYRAGRDHRISRTISSTDLSNKTKLPFYVASDRQGTFMEATIGESAFANYEPDANTVGLWHLEEQAGSGAYIKDSSSYGNNGTPTGTTPVQGKIGKGRSFNGSSDLITFPSALKDPTTFGGQEGTSVVSAWIYPTNNNQRALFTRIGGWHYLGLNASGNFQGMVWNCTTSANYWPTSNSVIPINQWSYVVIELTGNGYKFYINGNLDKVVTDSNICIIDYGGTPSLADQQGIGWGNWVGIVDEFRIDKTSRTPDEIRQAYEVGRRTHPITIDFKAKLDSGNLISNSSDYSFTIDGTAYGAQNKGDNLYKGDKIIVKEKIGGTEYLAQGTVTSVDNSTGAVTVASWDSGSTFPSSGFTANATVFKWQREYFDITGSLPAHRNAINRITLRITDGSQGANVWLDDIRSAGSYLTNPSPATNNITSSIGYRYFQYRAIFSSNDTAVSPSLTSVTLSYETNSPPNTPTLNSPANGATNQSLTPALKTTATDSDGNYLRYKIQLCTNQAMTQNCQTFDQTSSQTGWSGQNTESNTAYTSGTQATYTIQTPLSPGTTYFWRSYAIDPGGTNTWSSTQATPYSFTTSYEPTAPTAPWCEGQVNPTNISVTNPRFSAIFNDPDSSDTGTAYEIEVGTDSDWAVAEMWDTGKVNLGVGSTILQGTRSGEYVYNGSALTLNGTTYYWRIRFWDAAGNQGAWSETQHFTTVNLVPPTDCVLIKNADNTQITVRWTDTNSIEEGYQIDKATDSVWAPTPYYTAAANATSYLDTTGISSGHTYQYRIRAKLNDAYSAWCYTPTNSLQIGGFKFDGLKMEGVKIY